MIYMFYMVKNDVRRQVLTSNPRLEFADFTPLYPANEFDTILGDEGRKAGVTETRRKFFALSGGHPAALAFIGMDQNTTLSIFVDESGNLPVADNASRFYIVSLVVHNQQVSIEKPIRELNESFARMGLPNLCFHTGPLIRREDGYEYMGWEMRNRIFAAMMAFARKTPFCYRSVCVDKKFVASEKQIVAQLKSGISEFLDVATRQAVADFKIKVYYDCGQAVITNLIHESMTARYGDKWEFAQNVRPDKYRLFQVADLVSTISLMAQKQQAGIGLTKSEEKFFGGARNFKRNVLKPIFRKKI